MRTRRKLLASALTCAVLVAVYHTEATSARAVTAENRVSDMSGTVNTANVPDGVQTLTPGQFRLTTGLGREPHHLPGPVTCDTRDDTYRIAIGDQDAGGVEIGLYPDESTLKYADLGNRGGTYFMLFNDAPAADPSAARGIVRKAGDTYVVSGEATGISAGQHLTRLHFDLAVACP